MFSVGEGHAWQLVNDIEKWHHFFILDLLQGLLMWVCNWNHVVLCISVRPFSIVTVMLICIEALQCQIQKIFFTATVFLLTYHAQMGLQFDLKPLEGALQFLNLCACSHQCL